MFTKAKNKKPKFILPRGVKLPEELFDAYPLGERDTFPGGTGWNGEGLIALPHIRTVALETFDTYPTGAADDSTMTDGTGWDGAPTIHQY